MRLSTASMRMAQRSSIRHHIAIDSKAELDNATELDDAATLPGLKTPKYWPPNRDPFFKSRLIPEYWRHAPKLAPERLPLFPESSMSAIGMNPVTQQPDTEVIQKAMGRWIERVVASYGLCPFAMHSKSEVVVVRNRPPTFVMHGDIEVPVVDIRHLEFLEEAVIQEARSLALDMSPGFRTTLVVFPNFTSANQESNLYDEVVNESRHLIGDVYNRNPGPDTKIQAIPFGGEELSRENADAGVHIQALAPWFTIQLLRYSDLAKIPATTRKRIMERNEVTDAKLSDDEKLDMVRACRYG